jgi:hypothetical protein
MHKIIRLELQSSSKNLMPERDSNPDFWFLDHLDYHHAGNVCGKTYT